MRRATIAYGDPKLPRTLLDQVQDPRISKKRQEVSRRKDRRKQERAKKKPFRPRGFKTHMPQGIPDSDDENENKDDDRHIEPSPPPQAKSRPATQSILKRKPPTPPESISEEEDEEVGAPVISRATRERLEDDDDEIAALEKKLGLNKKKSRKTGDEELDWLVYGSGSEDGEGSSKRKRPEDEQWLQSKRRKSGGAVRDKGKEDLKDEDDEEFELGDAEGDMDGIENPFSEDELSQDGFVHLDDKEPSEPEPIPKPKKQRENPFVAPTTSEGAMVPKYVPPSLRSGPSSDDELMKLLRRQVQGQLNRLSDANLLSILHSVQDLYSNNARQYVTSTLVELLRGLICDPAVLNDTFLILHAGFATALYRVIGADFGAQLLERLVPAFDQFHGRQSGSSGEIGTLSEGKQALNVVTFLSHLYVLNGLGCEIIFDYIRMLLDKDNFSEANTELLLRIIRVSGMQLRQDDPTSLKDIVILLQKTTSTIGEANVSVRTKFMIETIHSLKNNRMKTGLAASALSAEHTQRMRKTLGSMNSVKTTEPLRITLSDIRDSDKKGKWWLIGASYKDPSKMARRTPVSEAAPSMIEEPDAGTDSEASETPDLDRVARAQGMNTDVRRAIFVAIAGAVDYQHAHMRIMKLNLKNKQHLEIPRVLLQCVGAEPSYNHFYTLVATQFCSDHRMRKAWQFALLDIFRRMGAGNDDHAEEDNSDQNDFTVQKIYNIAKTYATLVSKGLLRLTILKHLDFLSLSPKSSVFAKVFLTASFISQRKKAHKDGYEEAVKEAFVQVHAVPEIISGLKYYLMTVIKAAELAENNKERKVIQLGCEYAVKALADEKKRAKVLAEDALSDED